MNSKQDSLLRAAALLWCGAITLVYLHVCIQTLLNPFNVGDERIWAIGIAIAAASAILAHLFAPLVVLRLVFPAVLAVIAAVIVIRSASTLGLLIAALQIAAALGAGELAMRLLHIAHDEERDAERLLICSIAGIGLLGLAAIVLAALNLLILTVVAPLLAAAAWFAVRPLRSLFTLALADQTRSDDVGERPLILVLGGFMVLLNLIWTVAPEVQYDALNYHLPVAAAYAREGGIVDLLYVHSYLAGLVETFYALAFVFQSRPAAEFLPFAIALLTTGCVYMVTDRLAGRRASLWSALLFYSAPLVMWASSTSDVDLAVGAFVVAATLCLLRWTESGKAAWFYMSAILLGAGVGTKPTVGMLAPAMGVLCIVFLARRSAEPFRSRLRTVLVAALLVAAVSIPWYAVRFTFTGNPFYPALHDYFQSHRDHLGKGTFGGNFRIPMTPTAILSFPFAFTVNTDAYSESGVTDGGVGPWLLLAIPLAPLPFMRGRLQWKIVIGLAICYVGVWSVIFSYARFYIPILPLVVPLGAAVLSFASRRVPSVTIAMFSIIFAGQSLSMPVQYWMTPERIPIRNALGFESDDDFLNRILPGMSAVRFLNGNSAPGERAIGLGFERVRYYLEIPFDSWRGIPEVRPLARMEDPAKLIRALDAKGYDWLIMDRREAHNRERYLRKSFSERYGELEFEVGQHVVYRLKP